MIRCKRTGETLPGVDRDADAGDMVDGFADPAQCDCPTAAECRLLPPMHCAVDGVTLHAAIERCLTSEPVNGLPL